jgi:hypothetical protein
VTHAAGSVFPWPPKVEVRFKELVDAGCDRSELDSFLVVLKLMTIVPSPEAEMMFPRGMTPRVLENLPSRLGKIAEEVDRVNKHALFEPTNWLPQSTLAHRLTEREFKVLPGIVRRYADYIDLRTKSIKKFR